MTKENYFYNVLSERKNGIVAKQIISGFTCIENDRFFTLKKESLLEEGDIIEYNNVGSYTMCLSPLFIKYYPMYMPLIMEKCIKLEKNGQ